MPVNRASASVPIRSVSLWNPSMNSDWAARNTNSMAAANSSTRPLRTMVTMPAARMVPGRALGSRTPKPGGPKPGWP